MQRPDTVDGLYVDGNPSLGTTGTIVAAARLNSIQEEICNVIEEAGITVQTEETDTQDQLKTAIKQLARTCKYVSDSDGNPVFDIVDILPTVPTSSWLSIGPTGSGRDEEWSALDDIPSDSEWIRVRIYHSVTATAAGQVIGYLHARKYGSAVTLDIENRVSMVMGAAPSGSAQFGYITEATIPISNGSFELRGDGSNLTSQTLRLLNVGPGINSID